MRDDLDPRAMRAFVAVVEAGDFTAAARRLGVTRSSIGKAVARLEARLDVRLLHRTTRRVSMTADGAVFHDHCVRLLAGLAAAEAAVGRRREVPRGVLRLTVPDAYGRARIAPVLLTYMRRWPRVGVEVSFTDHVVDIVEAGLDLAFRTGLSHASDGLISRTVDRIHGVLCASPGYLAARGIPDGTLEGHDLLLLGHRGWIRPWPWPTHGAGTRPLRERARMVLDSAEAQRVFALAGLGIAHLPDFLVAPDLRAGTLVAIPSRPVEAIDVHVLYPGRDLLPARVRSFIDLLAAEL